MSGTKSLWVILLPLFYMIPFFVFCDIISLTCVRWAFFTIKNAPAVNVIFILSIATFIIFGIVIFAFNVAREVTSFILMEFLYGKLHFGFASFTDWIITHWIGIQTIIISHEGRGSSRCPRLINI
jgi:hypothetical protein